MDATMQKLYVNLPISEVNFFKEFIRKMGWTICDNVAEKQSDNTPNELCADIPDDIMSFVGLASNLNNKDIDDDDKLSYLIQK